MGWVHPPPWAIYIPIEIMQSLNIHPPPPTELAIFYSSSPTPQCLLYDLNLGVSSVPVSHALNYGTYKYCNKLHTKGR